MFRVDSDWQHNAVIQTYHPSWYVYAHAYRMGADRLVASAMQDRRDIDYLVFPIAFMYRQYLELGLKALILDAEELANTSSADPYGHRLDVLWNRCERALLNLENPPSLVERDVIGKSIDQFGTIDASSVAFRYPVTKDGHPVQLPTTHINLRVLRDEMKNVGNVIESLLNGLSAMVDLKREFEGECGM